MRGVNGGLAALAFGDDPSLAEEVGDAVSDGLEVQLEPSRDLFRGAAFAAGRDPVQEKEVGFELGGGDPGGVFDQLVVRDAQAPNIEGAVGEAAPSPAGDLEDAAAVAEIRRVHEHVHAGHGEDLVAVGEALADQSDGHVLVDVVEDERGAFFSAAKILEALKGAARHASVGERIGGGRAVERVDHDKLGVGPADPVAEGFLSLKRVDQEAFVSDEQVGRVAGPFEDDFEALSLAFLVGAP